MAQELRPETRSLVISRIKNYEYLSREEQAVQAIRTIAKDFYIYCERNLCIKDKRTRQVVPFELNWAQKLLVERVLDDLACNRPVRYIILKARQMGLSTVIEALCFWWTTTHRNINSVIIAHESDASSNLYKMFRRYYENAHAQFQPDLKYNTRKDLVFDVEDNIKAQYRDKGQVPPGLGSQIKPMVAKEGRGRSDNINFFHGSEVAFWEDSADVVAGALQAVALAPETFVFLESTANGIGGYFYSEWQHAKKGDSVFKPIFFAWHEHYEYELDKRDKDGKPSRITHYDEEELELLEIFKEKNYLPDSWDRKLFWRREKKKEFRSDPQKFYQEYPKDDMEAFLSSGRPVFDMKKLIEMEKAAEMAKPLFGDITKVMKNNVKRYSFKQMPVIFQDQDPSPLKVWELPVEDKKYTIGVDVSEGKLESSNDKKENDWSVIDVMRQDTLKTVARWRGHIDPDLLAEIAYDIGSFYNNALIGVEINNHGLTTVQGLRNRFYRNLYHRESSEEDQFQTRTAKMGWRTDRRTKPLMINELAKAIRDGDIIDLDISFIRECMTYVRDDQGHTNAQEGMFDDTVIAKAINLQMSDWNSYDQEYVRDNIRKPIRRNVANASNSLDSIAAGTKAPNYSHREAVSRRREARSRHRAARRAR